MNALEQDQLVQQLRVHQSTCVFPLSCLTCDALNMIERLLVPSDKPELLPLVAILLEKLGGEVFITDRELMEVKGMVSYSHDMQKQGVTMQVRANVKTTDPHGEG